MSFRAKMIISAVLFFGLFSLFVATVPTFGRRCAVAYDPKSPAYELCIDRLMTGGTVHFYKRVVMEPVTD